jgi:signal transduction histidine kinase
MAPHLADADPQPIVLIEDDPGDALMVSRALRKQGQFPYSLVHFASLDDFLALPRSSSDEVILLDLYLPGYQGLEALREVLSAAPDAAIVVLTGLDDSDVAVSALEAGAQDYLVKLNVNPHEICRAIRYAVGRRAAHETLMRVCNEFVTHVSHELRTPITAAGAAVEILQDCSSGQFLPHQERCLSIVSRSMSELNSMISDLLHSAEISNGVMHIRTRDVPLLDIVSGALTSLAPLMRAAELELRVDVRAAVTVRADPERLALALTKIVKNSIDHTPGGGRIDITLGPSAPSGQVTLCVRDNGSGIPSEAIPRLFDRLYQVPGGDKPASRRGLGFGLYLTREIVRAHGGDIRIASREGEGTTVALTLPVAAAPGRGLDVPHGSGIGAGTSAGARGEGGRRQ